MQGLSFLLTWYNIPFLAFTGVGLVLVLTQILGGFGDSDADADADVDADVDADADVDGDADADGFFGDLFASLGIGKVPLSMVLMVLFLSIGLIGLVVNVIASQALGDYPQLAFLPVLLLTLLMAFFLTGRISRGMARVVGESSTAITFEQLVGRVGMVVSPTVSPSYGRVQVRDGHGSLHTVYAITEGEPIPERSEVALLEYDGARRCFVVRRMAH